MLTDTRHAEQVRTAGLQAWHQPCCRHRERCTHVHRLLPSQLQTAELCPTPPHPGGVPMSPHRGDNVIVHGHAGAGPVITSTNHRPDSTPYTLSDPDVASPATPRSGW